MTDLESRALESLRCMAGTIPGSPVYSLAEQELSRVVRDMRAERLARERKDGAA